MSFERVEGGEEELGKICLGSPGQVSGLKKVSFERVRIPPKNCRHLPPHLGGIWADLSGLLLRKRFHDSFSSFIKHTHARTLNCLLCARHWAEFRRKNEANATPYSPCGPEWSGVR